MGKNSISGITKRQLIEKSSSTIVISTIVAAVAVSFSLVILNFLWGLSSHYNRVIAEKSKADKVLTQNVDAIESLQANFNVLEAGDVKSSTILDALPSKYDYPALATSIDSLVSSSGLTLESFSGDDLEEIAVQEMTVPEPVEIQFSLSVSGDYADIQKFISNMDRTIRPIRVVSIQLKGSDSSMDAVIQAVTYYQPATSLEVEKRTIE